ncbi:class I SAM-dependent methyltransferase [Vibrio sp. vnigr-6D03]|uniref:class I SAM-dependent DNA methyltransferase n=1 Tax=Vibrio sp. vnigr-6D03 TaxID=2058088 RepID=UPI000C321AEE|nr:class I SAM-dependent methyltransferase [Vibrio sp. vnigr-6D03]PKF80341.1 class I SAM-dependent methyltransferase [Vibrio sp. vnigr-6D03]
MRYTPFGLALALVLFYRGKTLQQSKTEFWSGEEYDAQYDHLYSAEISFLQSLIQQKKIKNLLDVCCGTGIVTIPLSTDLTHCVGIDFSLPMINHAKSKSCRLLNIYFHEMDAATFNLRKTFDLVSMTGNAFQAFISDEDLISVLSNIRQHMNHNSLFVFDSRLRGLTSLEVTNSFEHWDSYISAAGLEVQLYGRGQPHEHIANTMLLDIRREYQNGVQYYSQIELKYRSLSEIRKHLARCNLELVELYSNWERSPFENSSKSIVGVVRAL